MDFVIGGLAGAGATIFTNPMDVVKTRLQLQGELRSRKEQATRYRGIFHACYVIAKADGVLALQKGLTPAMLLGFCMNSVRLGSYHIAEVKGWTRTDGATSIQKAVFWSSASGLLSGVAANPMSVVKTRMQSAAHPSVAVGRQYRYKGTLDAFAKIYRTEGMKGYFAGVNATCMRLAVGSAAQLTTFSALKDQLLERGLFQNAPITLAFVASLACGVLCALLETPLDVVSTRIFNQGSGLKNEKLYTGVFDCIKKILKTEGAYGLYKGIGPLYLRIAPHTTLSLVIWDMLNIVFENKNR
ncbi:solute carrier family 25 member 35-like [Zerene cesonia]|uniref:solute carrier family 25 member 35-like n=1 Tax=Zerene cesonia TaxID=33412 RepID=UPI0018E54850|nr:solute carrier family 25 member 35-like [Zerene cesonia]XP_038215954.1 solute carrier family 25 member 35-like [Zerene cesonia]